MSTHDPALAELLDTLSALYPLPDDDARAQRAADTAAAVQRWMARAHADIEAMIPRLMAKYRVGADLQGLLARIEEIIKDNGPEGYVFTSELRDVLDNLDAALTRAAEPSTD